MIKNRAVFTKKRALILVLGCAAVLAVLIALRWMGNRPDLSTLDGRLKFISELGWEVDAESEQCRGVILPEVLDGVMADYNAMQLEQGYDLNKHLGERCEQYTYMLTNYPDSAVVYITLYVQGRQLIAGDIHTVSINGFMHGIERK